MARTLDSNIRDEVCELLNKKTIKAKNFRELAKLIDYNDKQIQELEEQLNPMYSLLEEWQAGPTSTVEALINLLCQMKRDDIIEILNKA